MRHFLKRKGELRALRLRPRRFSPRPRGPHPHRQGAAPNNHGANAPRPAASRHLPIHNRKIITQHPAIRSDSLGEHLFPGEHMHPQPSPTLQPLLQQLRATSIAVPLDALAVAHNLAQALRVDAGSMTPWIVAAVSALPHPDAQRALEADIEALAPARSFLLWLVDDEARQRVVLSVDHGRARWQQESAARRQLADQRELLRQLQGDAPAPIRLVRAAQVLKRSDLSHRFYRDIHRAIVHVQRGWESPAPLDDAARHSLALTLFTRLMFLHFIQAKGWLPSENYLRQLSLHDGPDAYATYWRPLFFDALNRQPDARISGVIPKEIPYLNGGLFAPTPLEAHHPELRLPAEVIRTQVIDTLSAYRFTDDEQDPAVNTIAPNLLGEIFERLMARDDRRRTGAFYTPSPLAQTCFRQTLSAHLLASGLCTVAEKLHDDRRFTPPEAEALLRHLHDLRVLDPAVGTGAFLLAALQCMEALTLRATRDLNRPPPDLRALREHWVSHALHGIDIHPDAIALAELRLWLWVVAAAPDRRDASTPLPNLEHRLRVGDALITPLWHAAARASPPLRALHRQLTTELHSFASKRGEARQKSLQRMRALETKITDAQRELRAEELQAALDAQRELFNDGANAHKPSNDDAPRRRRREHRDLTDAAAWSRTGHFDPKLHYADVMTGGGFDLIVGNPPWTQLSLHDRDLQRQLRDRYLTMNPRGGRSAAPDISLAFFEAYTPLLRPRGRIGMLFPAKALRAGWGAGWRQWVERSTQLDALHELDTHSTHGFRAAAYPAFAVLGRRQPGEAPRPPAANHVQLGDAWRATSLLPPLGDGHALHTRTHARRYPEGTRPLAELCTIRYGVKTGCNAVFLSPDPALHTLAVPAVRGRDLRREGLRQTEWLFFPHDLQTGAPIDELPAAAREALEVHRGVLEARTDLHGHTPWWRLFRVRPEGLGWRVVWRDIATRLEAVVLPPVWEGGPVNLNSTYYVGVADEAQAHRLCAMLNDDTLTEWLTPHAQRARNGFFRFDSRLVGMAPISPTIMNAGRGALPLFPSSAANATAQGDGSNASRSQRAGA